MSKARRRPTDKPMKQLSFFPEAPPRSADDVDGDVMRALSGLPASLPSEVVKALRRAAEGVSGKYDAATEWDSFKASTDYLAPRHRTAGRMAACENEFIGDLVLRAATAGFWLALQRYATHLRGSKEAMGFIRARKSAGDKGRAKSSSRKQTRQAESQKMLAAGMDEKAIALHFGVDRSTVYRWLKPAEKRAAPVAPSRKRK